MKSTDSNYQMDSRCKFIIVLLFTFILSTLWFAAVASMASVSLTLQSMSTENPAEFITTYTTRLNLLVIYGSVTGPLVLSITWRRLYEHIKALPKEY